MEEDITGLRYGWTNFNESSIFWNFCFFFLVITSGGMKIKEEWGKGKRKKQTYIIKIIYLLYSVLIFTLYLYLHYIQLHLLLMLSVMSLWYTSKHASKCNSSLHVLHYTVSDRLSRTVHILYRLSVDIYLFVLFLLLSVKCSLYLH